MMAFRIAWFKVHQPLAFYAAYFYRRSQKGGFDEGMMCHGIEACQEKKLQEIKEDEDSSAKDDDLFTTLEVCYEFYLRPSTLTRIYTHSTRGSSRSRPGSRRRFWGGGWRDGMGRGAP